MAKLRDLSGLLEDLAETHENVQPCEEHGSTWVQCLPCGALWAVHNCATELGDEGQELEEIEPGDGSCLLGEEAQK